MIESQPLNGNTAMPSVVLFGVVILAWTTASWASNMVGMWPAIGSVALILGVLTMCFDFEACRQLLRLY